VRDKLKQAAKKLLHAGLPVPAVVRPLVRGLYGMGVVMVEAWAFLYKLLWVEPVLRSICEHVGSGLRAERLPYIRGLGRIRIGRGVNLSGRSCFYFLRGMPESPSLEFGDRVFVGNGCTFSVAKQISVGSDCLIAAGVRVHDNDGHPLDAARRIAGDPLTPEETAPVVIEDGVWVGADSVILKGVRIGRHSVVGAGSIVTGDIPPDSLAAGNPAKVIRRLQAGNDVSPSGPVSG